MMMIGELGMPEDQGDQVGHLPAAHLTLPPIEQGRIAGVEHRFEDRFQGIGSAVTRRSAAIYLGLIGMHRICGTTYIHEEVIGEFRGDRLQVKGADLKRNGRLMP